MSSFAALLKPFALSRETIKGVSSVILGTLFLALMAHCSFPLWFTPVPVSLQSLGVLLLGALLGSKRGALSVVLYLIEGAIGFPVFAGGASGLAVFFGPTGGYLVGFVLSAYLVGLLLEKGWKRSYPLTLVALILAALTNLACGALWLGYFVGMENTLALGVYPFLFSDCLFKALVALAMISSARKFIVD